MKNTQRKLVKATWDEASKTPAKQVYKDGNFIIEEVLIPYDYDYSTVTYFVEYHEGRDCHSCGSCLSLDDAKKRIEELKAKN